jgi:hypothetical protein
MKSISFGRTLDPAQTIRFRRAGSGFAVKWLRPTTLDPTASKSRKVQGMGHSTFQLLHAYVRNRGYRLDRKLTSSWNTVI